MADGSPIIFFCIRPRKGPDKLEQLGRVSAGQALGGLHWLAAAR